MTEPQEPRRSARLNPTAPMAATFTADDLANIIDAATQRAAASIQAAVQPAGAPSPSKSLPSNAFKLPSFVGAVSGTDRVTPSAVKSVLARIDAFFKVYGNVFTDDSLKLGALLSCFPTDSRAARWFEAQNFTTYAEFVNEFEIFFGPTDADKKRTRDRWFSFRQRDTDSVRTYYDQFLKLASDLEAIGDGESDASLAAKFVNGLKRQIKTEVHRIFVRNPSFKLEQLLAEAEVEESCRKFVKPTFNSFENRGKVKVRRCWYCKSLQHNPNDCPKIAQRKAAGTWEERPPRKQRS
jgi:hypothetical protein